MSKRKKQYSNAILSSINFFGLIRNHITCSNECQQNLKLTKTNAHWLN